MFALEGTGSNACYIEKADKVLKWAADASKPNNAENV